MSGATLWCILFYVLPLLAVIGAAITAVFSRRFSKELGIDTTGDVLMVGFVGILPVFNLWLVGYVAYFYLIQDWWEEAKRDYLHRLLHD